MPTGSPPARRTTRLLTTLALALVAVACYPGGPGGGTEASPVSPGLPSSVPVSPGLPSAEPPPASAPPILPVPTDEVLPDGRIRSWPRSLPALPGAVEVITVVTHCGFEGSLDWDGSFWREEARSPEGGPIGDFEDTGPITLIDADTARFQSSTGTLVRLQRIDGPVIRSLCD